MDVNIYTTEAQGTKRGENLCDLCASVVSGLAVVATAAEPSAKAITAAIGKSLALLEKSSVTYPTHRTCFSCHH